MHNYVNVNTCPNTLKEHYGCLGIEVLNVADKLLISRSLFLQNECLLLYIHLNNLVELFELFLW